MKMASISSRRRFVKHAAVLLAGAHASRWVRLAAAAETGSVIAETSAGKVRGVVAEGVNIFKGIPYGGTTAGKNRFMPPTKPTPWAGTLVALDYGPSAPQGSGDVAPGSLAQSEDCLVLNVFTPALRGGRNRPVMVWLHGGGFSTGSGSKPILDGTNLAHT